MEFKTCYLCGRVCRTERHHIYSGARRPISESYNLTVDLCPECHQRSGESAHRDAATAEQLHKDGQRMAMLRYGWTVEEFRLRLGKNYLDAEELAEVEREMHPEPEVSSFRLLEPIPLMF